MTRRRTRWTCPRCATGVWLHVRPTHPPCCPCGGRVKNMTEQPEEATHDDLLPRLRTHPHPLAGMPRHQRADNYRQGG